MTEAHDLSPEPSETLTRHRQRLIDLFTGKHPGVIERLHPATLDLMTQALAEIEQKYSRYPYHNQEHTYDVIHRAVEWLHRLSEELDQALTDTDYDVVVLGAAYHDFHLEKEVREDGIELSPERRSALEATERMASYPVTAKQRVFAAIMSTEVSVRDDEVTQKNIGEGEPDIAVTAVARADIGTIYDQPWQKYYSDIGRLMAEKVVREMFGDKSPLMSVINVALKQTDFVKRRVDDLCKEEQLLRGTEDSDSEQPKEKILGIPSENLRRALGRATRIEQMILESRSQIERAISEAADDTKELSRRLTDIIANIFTKPTE